MDEILNSPEFAAFAEQFSESEIMEMNSRIPKNCQSTEHFRKVGNEHYMKKDYEGALFNYNLSLCYASPRCIVVSLTYGNRSAVYCEIGKYALALENIALARKHGYPAEKMAQLNAREEKCKKLMEEFGPDKNPVDRSFFKLSHPPNEKIPFIADCLELRKNEKYGRYIITNKDLKTGDIVAIEKPAFAWHSTSVLMEQACFFCTKTNNGSLIPCSNCTKVMFCSDECQEMADSFHQRDEANKITYQMCLKMLCEACHIAGGEDEALQLLKDSSGKTIFDFDFSDPDDPDYEKKILIALHGLSKNDKALEIMEANPELLDIPPINENPGTAGKLKQILKFIISQVNNCSGDSPCGICHKSIFLLQSLLTHSCIPNVYAIKVEEKSVLIVARPIKAGEQLFKCLNDCVCAQNFPKNERLEALEHSEITCDCEACVNDWPCPFPKKQRSFVEPGYDGVTTADAIERFKKNCKFIDKKAEKMPCYEVAKLMDDNNRLAHIIGKLDFNCFK